VVLGVGGAYLLGLLELVSVLGYWLGRAWQATAQRAARTFEPVRRSLPRARRTSASNRGFSVESFLTGIV
jgi:hypothetical protein